MKFLGHITLGALALASTAASYVVGTEYNREVVRAASPAFASRDGLRFTINGETKYFAGSNAYWIGFLTKNSDVDLVLDHFAKSGMKILRVWGFNDVDEIPGNSTVYYQSFIRGSNPVINTGPMGLQRLDYVVEAAEKRGIKLILNFVNNWNAYGGMEAYMKHYGGDFSNNNEDWYTSAAIQSQYQKYIRAVVSRYRNSRAIFAWELANEPRCKGCDTSVVTDWARSTSRYIKSLDCDHMVTLGDEGMGLKGGNSYPYSYDEGVDFEANLEIDDLDFGTFHLYPTSWGTSWNFGNPWIEDHGAACAKAGKPCLFEEYGVEKESLHCSVEGKWQTTALKATGIAADLFWQVGDDISTGPTADDGFTIYYGSPEWQCSVVEHIEAIDRESQYPG